MEEKSFHVLLVEDNDDHALLVRRALRDATVPLHMDRVADGAAAMDYLLNRGPFQDRPRPDLILLDLKLPKIDGHEVLRQVRAHPALAMIPTIILSTSDALLDRTIAYRNGANSYLVKLSEWDRFHHMLHDAVTYWAVWNHSALQ